MDLRQCLALRQQWTSRLASARGRHEEEIKEIHLRFLPLFLLTLERNQLNRVYEVLFRKPPPARLPNVAAGVASYKNKRRVVDVALWVQKRNSYGDITPREKRAQYQRNYMRRNGFKRKVLARLQRLQPEHQEKEQAQRNATREQNNARCRAWWAAMAPEKKRQYVRNQWKRMRARLKAVPGEYEAYIERKHQQAVARRERIYKDPAAKAKYKEREAKKYARRRERGDHRVYYETVIKENPERLARHKEQRKRVQRRQNLKRTYSSPNKVKELRQRILALLPGWMPGHLRQDIAQDALEQVFRGEVGLRDLPIKMKSITRRAQRFELQSWKQKSLDARIPGTTLRLIDTIAAD